MFQRSETVAERFARQGGGGGRGGVGGAGRGGGGGGGGAAGGGGGGASGVIRRRSLEHPSSVAFGDTFSHKRRRGSQSLPNPSPLLFSQRK
ncbi:hypothetical protein MPL3365_60122 [Mesorhizobium plurifarium]|uniref:Uncharacterized protein n=1 Tax=Mesorhizobium plurifarium TaxID=69974 RepID=A0A090GVU6_MESPL|nr:hypothetical protein MPL3365_60122 [Mesorhizobium plurifarium]